MAFGLHTLLSFRGTIGDSGDNTEIWSFGLRIAGTAAPNDTTVVAASGMTAAKTAMETFMDSGAGFLNDVRFVEVRGYRIDAAGHARGPVAIAGPTTPHAGPLASVKHPWQCTTVVSLVHQGIGPGRKGRVYLPPQGLAIDANGHISDLDAANTRTAFASFLAAVIAPAYEGTTTRPVVASKTYGSLLTIDQLRVGRVMDTQRRRRNNALERYNSGVFPG